MSDFMRGEPLRPGDRVGVIAPMLVLAGGKSESLLRNACNRRLTSQRGAPRDSQLSHNPNVRLLALAAGGFLIGKDGTEAL